jgi:hypothetical protein
MTVTKKTVSREDTAANWTSSNPTLPTGVYGHETDTGKIKKGDGSTAWASLAYLATSDLPIETDIEQSIDTFEAADGYVHLADAAGTVLGLKIGVKGNVGGLGFPLIATTETACRAAAVYADDNSAAIATGNSVAAFEARTVIAGTHGANDTSIGGAEGHVKLASGVTGGSNGVKYGLWGYYEGIGTCVAGTLSTGIQCMIDIPSTATIAAAAIVSGMIIKSNDISATRTSGTGKAVCLHMPTPGAGTWDALMYVTAAGGFVTANTKYLTAAGNSLLSHVLTILVDGTAHYIPVLSTNPTT